MRPVPLAVAAGISALAGCAPGPGIDTSRVELPTAEHGVALDPEELARQPVIELHADGTLVIDGVALTVEEQGAKGAVMKRLYDIAVAAPLSPRYPELPDFLSPDVGAALLVDRRVPFQRVDALCDQMSSPAISFRWARFAVRSEGGELRWLSMSLPERNSLTTYAPYRIEARTLDVHGAGPATVWWTLNDPTARSGRPPRRDAQLASLDALREALRSEALRFVSLHAPPDTPWAEIVTIVDAIFSAGCEFELAEVGELP